MKIGGYVMVDCKGLDLVGGGEESSLALYDELLKAISTNKPVVLYNCHYGENNLLTPVSAFLYVDSTTVVVQLPNSMFSVSSTGAISRDTPFSILSGPKDVEASVGERVDFSVVVSGKDISYQWEYTRDDGETWSNSTYLSGKTANIHFNAASNFNGVIYRCRITSGGTTIISNTATLTVIE